MSWTYCPAKWWYFWLLLTSIRCLHSEKEFEPLNQSFYVITVCNLGGYSLLWVPIVKSNQEKSLPNIHDKCLENRHSVIRVDTAIETDAVFSNLMAGIKNYSSTAKRRPPSGKWIVALKVGWLLNRSKNKWKAHIENLITDW